MSETCETVKIVSSVAPGGFVLINASEFDSAQHKIFGSVVKGEAEEKTDTSEVKLEEKKKAGRPRKL